MLEISQQLLHDLLGNNIMQSLCIYLPRFLLYFTVIFLGLVAAMVDKTLVCV